MNEIGKRFLEPGGNKLMITLGDDHESTLTRELYSFSLFESRRFIVVRHIQRLTEKSKKELLEYILKPSSEICLVIIIEDFYSISKNKFFRTLRDKTVVVDSRVPLNMNVFRNWVNTIIKLQGIQISDDALSRLMEIRGDSIGSVVNGLVNLWIMAGEKGAISLTDVEMSVGMDREYPVWKYLDALGRRDTHNAVIVLNSMIEYGVSPTQIVASQNTLFENIFWTKGNKQFQSGFPKLNKILMGRLKTYAHNFSLEKIMSILRKTRDVDIILKTSTVTPLNLLLILTIEICNEARA